MNPIYHYTDKNRLAGILNTGMVQRSKEFDVYPYFDKHDRPIKIKGMVYFSNEETFCTACIKPLVLPEDYDREMALIVSKHGEAITEKRQLDYHGHVLNKTKKFLSPVDYHNHRISGYGVVRLKLINPKVKVYPIIKAMVKAGLNSVQRAEMLKGFLDDCPTPEQCYFATLKDLPISDFVIEYWDGLNQWHTTNETDN